MASEMVLSPRTVEGYLARAKTKLGLHTRRDIVRFVLEAGLLRDKRDQLGTPSLPGGKTPTTLGGVLPHELQGFPSDGPHARPFNFALVPRASGAWLVDGVSESPVGANSCPGAEASRRGETMSGDQENKGCRASEMWVGMRKACGDTSMVVGITVADKTHVFLATREVFGKFADQIAAMPEAPIPSPDRSPRFLWPNGADRGRVAGVAGGRGREPGRAYVG